MTLPGLVALVGLLVYWHVSKVRRPWQRFTIAMLCVMILGNIFALYPIPLMPLNREEPATGLVFKHRPGFPFVLAVGDVSVGSDFASANWDYAWANLLEQEICGCSVVPVAQLNEESIAWATLLILTVTASEQITEEMARRVEDWVREGGCLIVEHPRNTLFDLTGVRLDEAGNSWMAQRITYVQGEGSLGYLLLDMPLATDYLRTASLGVDCQMLMKMDDQPVVLSRRVGRGAVIAFLFDVGQQLTALQQGVPDEGFRLSDKRGAKSMIDATDLLMNSELLDSPIPYADLLERWIVARIEDHVIFPRIWYFRYPQDGLVTMTHDEDWFGDESRFVIEEESASGYNSTFFIIAKGPITSTGLKAIGNLGGDIHIHWNREIKRWLLIFRKGDGSLEAQIRELKRKMGDEADVYLCRIERLRWGNDYTRPFRILEAQRIRLDSTLGSAGMTGKGYMYGTGLPYHPIDTNGKPFSLYELPFQIQARYSGINSTYIRELLSESKTCYHEVINALYHPCDLVEGSPSRGDWLGFHEMVQEQNHALVTLSEMLDWWVNRGVTEIANLTLDGAVLSFRCKTVAENIAFFLPLSRGDICSVMIDSEPALHTRHISLQGRKYLLVELPMGLHTIQVVFH